MPRYFFHVEDGASGPDQEGCELAGLSEAREAAAALAGGILQDGAATFWRGQPWSVRIVDEAGATVGVVHLAATVAAD